MPSRNNPSGLHFTTEYWEEQCSQGLDKIGMLAYLPRIELDFERLSALYFNLMERRIFK
jgi:hypothetical protein